MNIKKTIGVFLFGGPIAAPLVWLGIYAPDILITMAVAAVGLIAMSFGKAMIDGDL